MSHDLKTVIPKGTKSWNSTHTLDAIFNYGVLDETQKLITWFALGSMKLVCTTPIHEDLYTEITPEHATLIARLNYIGTDVREAYQFKRVPVNEPPNPPKYYSEDFIP